MTAIATVIRYIVPLVLTKSSTASIVRQNPGISGTFFEEMISWASVLSS